MSTKGADQTDKSDWDVAERARLVWLKLYHTTRRTTSCDRRPLNKKRQRADARGDTQTAWMKKRRKEVADVTAALRPVGVDGGGVECRAVAGSGEAAPRVDNGDFGVAIAAVVRGVTGAAP